MNFEKESLAINKSTAYFSTIKKSSPKFFRFCKLFGKGILSDGYIKYYESVNRTLNNLLDITYEYDNLSDLARFLIKKKHFHHVSSAIKFMNTIALERNENVSWNMLKKLKKIEKELLNEKDR